MYVFKFVFFFTEAKCTRHKVYHFEPFLSVRLCVIKHTHVVLPPSTPSSLELFHLPKLKLCPHWTVTSHVLPQVPGNSPCRLCLCECDGVPPRGGIVPTRRSATGLLHSHVSKVRGSSAHVGTSFLLTPKGGRRTAGAPRISLLYASS